LRIKDTIQNGSDDGLAVLRRSDIVRKPQFKQPAKTAKIAIDFCQFFNFFFYFSFCSF